MRRPIINNTLKKEDSVELGSEAMTETSTTREKLYQYNTRAHIAKAVVSLQSQMMITITNKQPQPASSKPLITSKQVSLDSNSTNNGVETSYLRTKHKRY